MNTVRLRLWDPERDVMATVEACGEKKKKLNSVEEVWPDRALVQGGSMEDIACIDCWKGLCNAREGNMR